MIAVNLKEIEKLKDIWKEGVVRLKIVLTLYKGSNLGLFLDLF